MTHPARAGLLVPFALLTLAACETTEGFVQDVENTTSAVYDEVD